MRKIFLMGLLALLFGLFDVSAFAGNAAECSYLKDKQPNSEYPDYVYQPGLYGLCIAWHNADEDDKVELGIKFWDRAGFDVPGSVPSDTGTGDQEGFECPCWAGVVLEDIGDYTPPAFCALGGVVWAEFETNDADAYLQTFITDGVDCVYEYNYEDQSGNVISDFVPLSGLESSGALCLTEAMEIINYYWPDGAGGAECF